MSSLYRNNGDNNKTNNLLKKLKQKTIKYLVNLFYYNLLCLLGSVVIYLSILFNAK